MTARRSKYVLEIPWRDPLTAFAPIAQNPWSILFHSSGDQPTAKWSIFCAEPEAVFIQNGAEALSVLPINTNLDSRLDHFPFVGGLAGLLSYEFGCKLENIDIPAKSNWPDIGFGQYPCCALFDHHRQKSYIIAPDPVLAKRFLSQLGTIGDRANNEPLGKLLHKFSSNCSDNQIARTVSKVIKYIHQGDIFQANISREFTAELAGDASINLLFEQLVAISKAPFCVSFRLGDDKAVLSNSPERFLSLSANGTVSANPVKGTRPRGQTEELDKALMKELLGSAKDRAENLMIVDLMRNDLSRVCEAGSVNVPELFAVQSFANVHHLVSTVCGRLKQDATAIDLLRATFPPGSITGAPKIRAMQIIAELESAVRGPYCGALGFISDHGAMDFNVLIRTLIMQRNSDNNWDVTFRAGGGIVADSDPLSEAGEMNDKASVFRQLAGSVQNVR
ncbi:MAG: anthranilate synthase component I family protein [Robiginitomaculum sp.]|nr:anthranilate synthase component I family protein [Robiginitomaculum sp.]